MAAPRKVRRGHQPPWLLAIGLLALLAGLGVLALPPLISYRYQSRIYAEAAATPSAPVAIVFGASVTPSGEPSPMLADRIEAAVELYRLGKVQRILMTGDNSQRNYDEVTAMKRYAVKRGVPADRVNLDHAGLRTYDSCYRAKAIFGITRAILVTQAYHLPRALYLAESFGIDAVGLKAGRESYPRQSYYNLRETAALYVSLLEVNLLHPLPAYLGEPVDLEQQNAG